MTCTCTCMEPKMGDVIAFKRPLFTHYGLYIGNGMIVHRDKMGGRPKVAISPMYDVPGNISIANNEYEKNNMKRVATEEAIRRAVSQVGDTEYNLITSNCEHFVTENKYGSSVSNQVNALRNIFIVSIGLFILKSI